MANIQIDPNRSPREQFLELVVRSSHTNHPETTVIIGRPSRSVAGDPAETMVSVSIRAKQFRNDRIVRYRRVDLQNAFLFQHVFVDVPAGATDQQIVDATNALGYTQLILSEIVIGPRNPGTDAHDTITITAKPESLLYATQFDIHVPKANADGPVGYRMALMGPGEHLLIRPNGDRSLMVSDGEQFLLRGSNDLQGCTILSSPGWFCQPVLWMVDARGNPVPEEQQPDTYAGSYSQYNNVQVMDKATIKAAIQQVIDAGMEPPSWYVPGCSLMVVTLDESCPEMAEAVIQAPGQTAPPMRYNWRIARFTATWKPQLILSGDPGVDLGSVVPNGTLTFKFPRFGKDPGSASDGDAGVIQPGSELTGGLLVGKDACGLNSAPGQYSFWRISFAGQITECVDIPEWVGKTTSSTDYVYVAPYNCTVDRKADLSTLAFNPPPEMFQRNLMIDDLTMPGGNDRLGYFASFYPTTVSGLQFEMNP